MILSKKNKYLQIALNSSLWDAYSIVGQLPKSERIIIEVGTPLIKEYGMEAIRRIHSVTPTSYIAADLKIMDRAEREVTMAKNAGASAAVCLGNAPFETINLFIKTCAEKQMDSMLDFMNMDQPIKLLRQLKKQPDVVILHRGVDEEAFNKDKPIPYLQINKILSSFDVAISIAGGDSIREVQRAVFNGASIVVVWKEFYKPTSTTAELATEFLQEVK